MSNHSDKRLNGNSLENVATLDILLASFATVSFLSAHGEIQEVVPLNGGIIKGEDEIHYTDSAGGSVACWRGQCEHFRM